MKKYRVTLEQQERECLHALLARGKGEVRRLKHAMILLKADESQSKGGWSDQQIADAIDVGSATVQRVRERFVEQGFEAALQPYKKGSRKRAKSLDGAKEAHLIALACGPAPEGRGAWTLRLLADKMVELNYVEKLSYETVRRTLKKRTQTASKKDVVHTAQAIGGVRSAHGRRARSLSSSL